MGYQETLFYTNFPKSFNKLVAAYKQASQAGIDLKSYAPTENQFLKRYSIQQYSLHMRKERGW